jgi:hypothetical protein
VNERWVCKRCFADNEGSSSACIRCGLIRGAEATPTDQQTWSAQAAAPAAQPAQAGWTKWLKLWWIPAIAIVLAVGYFASARRDGSGQVTDGGTLSVTDLRVGDCFDAGDETTISDVDAIPCNEAHPYQVFHVQDHPTASYPTDAEFSAIFESVCVGPFETFVGMSYVSSALYADMITPSEESFDDGDREYVCVLYDPANEALTSTMEGARR